MPLKSKQNPPKAKDAKRQPKVTRQVSAALSNAKGNYEIAKVKVGKETAHIESTVKGHKTGRSVQASTLGAGLSKQGFDLMGKTVSASSRTPFTDAQKAAAEKGKKLADEEKRKVGKAKIEAQKKKNNVSASKPIRPPLKAAQRVKK